MAFHGHFVFDAEVEGDFVSIGVAEVDATDVFNAPVGDEERLRDERDLAAFNVKFHPMVDVAEPKRHHRGIVEDDVVHHASPE